MTGTLLTQRSPHFPSRRETCLARSCYSRQPLCVLQSILSPCLARCPFKERKPGSRGLPRKVPTQSPSQLRSMGFPSLQAEMRRKEPSSNLFKQGRVESNPDFHRAQRKRKGTGGRRGRLAVGLSHEHQRNQSKNGLLVGELQMSHRACMSATKQGLDLSARHPG